MQKLIKNSIKCLCCGEVLDSKHQHDFVMCGCENRASTDGGLVYTRVGAKDLKMVQRLHEYTEVGLK